MPYYDVTTPLAASQHCSNEAEVRETIRQCMEGADDANLANVSVIQVPGMNAVETGTERPWRAARVLICRGFAFWPYRRHA